MKRSTHSPRPTSNLCPSVDQRLDAYALAASAAGLNSLSLTRPDEGKSDSVHRKLNPYALGATAAGVGLLALSQSAQAKIVYTPANVQIGTSSELPVPLDLNHDGVVDFVFIPFAGGMFCRPCYLKITPGQDSNEIIDQPSNGRPNNKTHLCAAALNADIIVGPKSRFHQDPAKGLYMSFIDLTVSTRFQTFFGPWYQMKGQLYLGLRFEIKGKTHYGWARVNNVRGYILTGYAYETIPNKPIITGATKGPDETNLQEPEAALTMPTRNSPSLGLLALGAPGLSIWRREEATEALAH